jgi:hypothetical protein
MKYDTRLDAEIDKEMDVDFEELTWQERQDAWEDAFDGVN